MKGIIAIVDKRLDMDGAARVLSVVTIENETNTQPSQLISSR